MSLAGIRSDGITAVVKPYLISGTKTDEFGKTVARSSEECLLTCREYVSMTDEQRSVCVITSKFKDKGRFGEFRLHASRDAALRFFFSQPPHKRSDCIVILENTRVLTYGDIDFPMYETDTDESIQRLIDTYVRVLSDTFRETFPDREPLRVQDFWWSECIRPQKISLHYHAPYQSLLSTHVWSSNAEQSHFVKRILIPRIVSDYPELSRIDPKSGKMKPLIDASTFNAKMNFKLALCSKRPHSTDHPPMLFRSGPGGYTRENPPSEWEQVDVSMCVLPVGLYAPMAHCVLPTCIPRVDELRVAKPRTPSATHAVGIRCATGLLTLIREVMGAAAQVRNIRIDKKEPTGRVELIGSTCLCPYNGHVAHGSNNQFCRLEYARITFDCYDATCATNGAARELRFMDAALMEEVYRGSHVIPEAEAEAAQPPTIDTETTNVLEQEAAQPPTVDHSNDPIHTDADSVTRYHFLSDAARERIVPLLAKIDGRSFHYAKVVYRQVCEHVSRDHGRHYHLLFLYHRFENDDPQYVSELASKMELLTRVHTRLLVVLYHQHTQRTDAWGVLHTAAGMDALPLDKKNPKYCRIARKRCGPIYGLQ